MASDEGKHAVNDVGACEEWCAACRKARKQAASDEGRARVLRERLGRRLSWGQVGVPEDGALLVECYEVLGRLSALSAPGQPEGER